MYIHLLYIYISIYLIIQIHVHLHVHAHVYIHIHILIHIDNTFARPSLLASTAVTGGMAGGEQLGLEKRLRFFPEILGVLRWLMVDLSIVNRVYKQII